MSAGHDGTIRLWNVDEYEETRTVKPIALTGHTDAVLAADFSPDELKIVTAGRDRTAKLWDVRTRKPIATLAEGHEYLTSNVAITPDGKRLITAAVDGTTRIWDFEEGVEQAQLPATGRNAALAVSRDGRLVLTGDDGKAAKLWNAETGELIRTLPGASHRNHRRGDLARRSPSIHRRNERTDQRLARRRRPGRVERDPSFAQDHRRRFHGRRQATSDGVARQHGRTLGREHRQRVDAVRLEASGRRLGRRARRRRSRGDGLRRRHRAALAARRGIAEAGSRFRSRRASIPIVAASADGRLLAAVDHEAHAVRLWDLEAKKRTRGREPTAHRPSVARSIFGSRSGLGRRDCARRFDARDDRRQRSPRVEPVDAEETQAFRPHGAVAGVAFSPDGRSVATAGWDDAVKIWNVADAHAVSKIRGGHDGIVNDVVYSRDGRRLLTAGDDGTARHLERRDGGRTARCFAGTRAA